MEDMRANQEREADMPYLTQDGEDITDVSAPGLSMRQGTYVTQIRTGSVLGFKYFDLKNLCKVRIRLRGKAEGIVMISTKRLGGTDKNEQVAIAQIPVSDTALDENEWKDFYGEASVLPGIYPLYFTYQGSGEISLQEFELY